MLIDSPPTNSIYPPNQRFFIKNDDMIDRTRLSGGRLQAESQVRKIGQLQNWHHDDGGVVALRAAQECLFVRKFIRAEYVP